MSTSNRGSEEGRLENAVVLAFVRENYYSSSRSSQEDVTDWKLAEAKNRPSELVTAATTEGPQTIRRHGDAVVVVSESNWRELTGERPSLKSLLLNGPSLRGVLPARDRSPMRGVDL